jgi:hypothetical protein
MQFILTVQDQATLGLDQFGDNAPKILDKVLKKIGTDYRAFVRKNYIRGQVIGKRTGYLDEKYKVAKDRKQKHAYIVFPYIQLANIYHHAGGADIYPKNKKVLHWYGENGEDIFAKYVHLKERPWVTMSEKAYPWESKSMSLGKALVEKELAKLAEKNNA